MKLFSYTGPVTYFNVCVANKWTSETHANSPEKAMSNLAYQYKKQNNLNAMSSIKLDKKYLKEIG